MKKLILVFALTLIVSGCNSIVIGTPTPEATLTVTPTVTNTSTITITPTDEGQKITPTATEEIVLPTQIVPFDPTAVPTHEIYIYNPSDTDASDDFVETIANVVNIRAGASFEADCVLPTDFLDPTCAREDREVLRIGDVRKVYKIYYDATLEQYWARINPESDPTPRWVSVNTLICRNAPDQPKIFCTTFK